MNLTELSNSLDKAIARYETEAGVGCSYCSEDALGDALHAINQAMANALSSFKADIITYLSQL